MKKAISAKNGKELAQALGLPESEAAEWEFRSELNEKIIELVRRSKITHAVLAKKVGTSRPRLTALLNRSRTDLSTDFMLRVLGAMGYRLEFKVTKTA